MYREIAELAARRAGRGARATRRSRSGCSTPTRADARGRLGGAAAQRRSIACSSSATRPTTSRDPATSVARAGRARGRRPAGARLRPARSPTAAGRSSTCRSSTTPTATSTPPARCSPTRTPCPGLGDGGAHVGTICDASFPTTLLAHWGRDRDHGRLDLPFLVQRQTQRHRPDGRPARPGRARARLPGRRQRDRLRPPRRPPARDAPRPARRRPAPGAARPTATSPPSSPAQVTYEGGEADRRRCPAASSAARSRARHRRSPMSTTDTTDDRGRPADLAPLEPRCEWRARRRSATATSSSSPTSTSPSSTPRSRTPRPRPTTCSTSPATHFPLPTLGPELARHHRRADRRARRRAHPRRPGRALHARTGPSAIYWGIGMHLGPAVAAERQGPPARRRHRPGPGGRRPDRPGQRDRRHRRSRSTPTAPTSSACSASTPAPSGGASLVANARRHPQRPGARRARAGGRALRAVPLRLPRRAGARAPQLVHDAGLHPARRPAVRALHPALHRVVAAPRRRAAAVRRGPGGDGPARRACAPTRSTTCR